MSNPTSVTAFVYNLGITAKDPITGYQGIIIGRAHHLFGCSQYGIASRDLDSSGQVRKTEWFDEARIEVVGDGTRTVEEVQENEFAKIFGISIGKKVRDKVTGIVGITTYALEYLYGSNQYAVDPGIDKEGKIQDSYSYDEGRLEVIDEGVKPAEVTGPKRGGINRDAPRF
jgi:hypothetical protein